MRLVGVALAAAAAGALAAWGLAAPAEPPGASPLPEGLRAAIAEIRGQVEEIRGLKFRAPVATASLTKEGARAYVRDLLRKEYPGESLAAEEETLRFLGLLAPGLALEGELLDLLEGQVAGLYDPERKTLYVVPGPVESRAALAHELAHALADQHFDLKVLQERARQDDDRALGLAALVEGEASVVMASWALARSAESGSADPVDALGDLEELQQAFAGLQEAPAYIRDTILFPYLQGTAWAASIASGPAGLGALDAWFLDPPESSEQILHPATPNQPRDRPTSVGADLPARGLPAALRRVKAGTLGEFGIRTLLADLGTEVSEQAAAGWDGDAYVLAGRPAAHLFAWVSAWDSEQEAAEFSSAARTWLDRRGAGSADPEETVRSVRAAGRLVVVAEGGGRDGAPAASARARAILSAAAAEVVFR